MGNGWHEWPLVLFTVLGQCVAGALSSSMDTLTDNSEACSVWSSAWSFSGS
jgi:DMSO reductase anchor subunit